MLSVGDALTAGDHGHPSGVEGLADPPGRDLADLRVAMVGVGAESGLTAGERIGGDPRVVQGHAHQGDGLALAGGDEHVHLAPGLGARDLVGQPQQVVGLLAHGTDHQNDLVATGDGVAHVFGHLADAFGGSATAVPPNFWTSNATSAEATGADRRPTQFSSGW